jgi:hypothetical protein
MAATMGTGRQRTAFSKGRAVRSEDEVSRPTQNPAGEHVRGDERRVGALAGVVNESDLQVPSVGGGNADTAASDDPFHEET